ncbi:MAG: acyl-CoA dehydrogenase domain-containing protein [Hyphomonadaceae bacterium]|nr:MAG: acyl-CoA dehydrogenase domain-containing protein [Hyphomonadaceae bacterium]
MQLTEIQSAIQESADMGLWGMLAPEEFGGTEADYVSLVLAIMEIARADGALSTIISVQNSLVVSILLAKGNAEQKARFLPKLIGGETIGCFCLTEPDAGSDASSLRTRASQTKGGWILNGAKQFITSGKIAGLAIVFAATDPEAGKRGLTAFLVPTDKEGFIIDKIEHKLGQHASDTAALRFDNLFIEDELVLGEVGEGYKIALSNLEGGRIGIAAQAIGMAQAALEIAIQYAKDRTTFGKPIIEHQAVGFRLAGLKAKLEAAKQLVLSAAVMKDAGLPSLIQASMAKLVASETAEEVITGSIQTLGGYGYLEEFGIAKIYRDSRVCQIYEGTSDIQKMVISRNL